MKTKAATALVIGFLALSPVYDQCDNQQFARANPGLCYPGPLGGGFSGGNPGGGNGGLLGGIARTLHNLTGGIL